MPVNSLHEDYAAHLDEWGRARDVLAGEDAVRSIRYPMAQNAIAPGELDLLDRSCEAFDQEIRGQIDVAGLKELAAGLRRRYPADPAHLG